jgi:hypothetical protein
LHNDRAHPLRFANPVDAAQANAKRHEGRDIYGTATARTTAPKGPNPPVTTRAGCQHLPQALLSLRTPQTRPQSRPHMTVTVTATNHDNGTQSTTMSQSEGNTDMCNETVKVEGSKALRGHTSGTNTTLQHESDLVRTATPIRHDKSTSAAKRAL